jgi:hypothetical protein
MTADDAPEGYEGEVTLVLDDGGLRTVHGALGARFDPLAGRVVWSGRVAAELPPRTRVTVATPHGRALAETTERDVWGNTRITGLDRPPFPVELLDGGDEHG